MKLNIKLKDWFNLEKHRRDEVSVFIETQIKLTLKTGLSRSKICQLVATEHEIHRDIVNLIWSKSHSLCERNHSKFNKKSY